MHMKSSIAKWVISIFFNLRYLRLKLLKYKENINTICDTFDHNFKNILIHNKLRYHSKGTVLDDALTSKLLNMALNPFCGETLHRQA